MAGKIVCFATQLEVWPSACIVLVGLIGGGGGGEEGLCY